MPEKCVSCTNFAFMWIVCGSYDTVTEPYPAAAGDHCSRSGIDTYDGSSAGEEKVSCAPDGLCSM